MQSVVFLTYFFQKLSKKDLWGLVPPVQEGLIAMMLCTPMGLSTPISNTETDSPKGLLLIARYSTSLRQVLFDIQVGNSNLAKSLSEKSNPALYQDENPHRCLLSLQN